MLNHFICARPERGTLEAPIPAPLFRREFSVGRSLTGALLRFCGLGFYRLYINGTDITKGELAPYISNTDDCVYVDEYDLLPYLREGENVLGAILGNGMQNALGAPIWELDKAAFQSAPRLAFELTLSYADGTLETISADPAVRTHPSALLFNDLWCGERYDARLETPGWNAVERPENDMQWTAAVHAAAPRGDQRVSRAIPIEVTQRRSPVQITPVEGGYLYDFGLNDAGVCALRIRNARPGQKIRLTHGEYWTGEKLNNSKILFVPEKIGQVDEYICKGAAEEVWRPRFSYYGFQYVLVEGVREEQADRELLTFLVMHAALEERGGFRCSDATLECLQEMTRRSALANFFFYPTDCPQREKHGWTDAGQLSELMMLNFGPEDSYREWLENIRRAQDRSGMLPSIVPMGDWGMGLGGPYWDAVCVYLPWMIWKYRGTLDCFRENAEMILRYLRFLDQRRDERGLIQMGIGDWAPVCRLEPRDFKSPIELTDTATACVICRRAGDLFEADGRTDEAAYARELCAAMRAAAREHLLDRETMTAAGRCQTSQACFLSCGLLEPEEEPRAAAVLRELIEENGGFMDVGCIGGRTIFHTLSRFGDSELAIRMIARPEFPSYGNWIERGATTLWENFFENELDICSRNHLMWGSISDWMFLWLAGLQINPSAKDLREICFRPGFSSKLSFAEAWHRMPYGKAAIRWEQQAQERKIELELPQNTEAWLALDKAGGGMRRLDLRTQETGSYRLLEEWDAVRYDIRVTICPEEA